MKQATMTVEFTLLVPDDTKLEDLTIEIKEPRLDTPAQKNVGSVTGYTTISVEEGDFEDDDDDGEDDDF